MSKRNRRQVQTRRWHAPHAHRKSAPESTQTLQNFLDYWLRMRKATIKSTTYVSYRNCITKYVLPALGHVPLHHLTSEQLQAFATLQQRTVSPDMVRFIQTVLHRVLADAVIWKRLATNPCKEVELPPPHKVQLHQFTREQAHNLLDAAREANLDTLLLLAITTNVRRRDLLALRWQDIDFKAMYLRVEQGVIIRLARSISESEVAGHELAPVQRIIPLPTNVIAALKRHRQRQGDQHCQAGEPWQERQLVFPNTENNQLSAASFHHLFRQTLQQAGLSSNMHLHELRHLATAILQALEDHSHNAAWEADFLEHNHLLEEGEGG